MGNDSQGIVVFGMTPDLLTRRIYENIPPYG